MNAEKLKIHATWNGWNSGKPECTQDFAQNLDALLKHAEKDGIDITVEKFATMEAAQAFVAHFPKYVKVHVYQYIVHDDPKDNYYNVAVNTMQSVSRRQDVNGVTGNINETGVKRVKAFIKVMKTLV